jgi:hypothetical protein
LALQGPAVLNHWVMGSGRWGDSLPRIAPGVFTGLADYCPWLRSQAMG